jgi:succinoglycan biosynthesis transport protein ExoP
MGNRLPDRRQPAPVTARYVDGRILTPGGPPGGVEAELRTYVDIMRRRNRLVARVVVSVLAIALVVTLFQDRKYRATALLEIRGGERSVPTLEGVFADEAPSEEDIRTHFGLLKSAALATRVIEDLGLDTLEEFSSESDTPMQAVAEGFLERLVVDPVEESRLVSVSMDTSSPTLSASIVNAVVDTYARIAVEGRERAAGVLGEQVDSAEARLEGAEEALLEFAVLHNLPYAIDEDVTARVGSSLTDLHGRLATARGERYESESLYDVIRNGRLEVLEDEVLTGLMTQLSDLRAEYARLAATFTDDYPETAEVRRQIEQVRTLIREEQQRLAARAESEFQLSLRREGLIAQAIEGEEEIAKTLGPDAGRYHVLRQAVLSNRSLLATLYERRREAEVAADIGSTSFAVVDRAVPPAEPYRPVFMLNLGLALMLALVLGLGAAFMKEMMDGTVRSADDLNMPEGLPVLALIPSLTVGDEQPQPLSARIARDLLAWPGTGALPVSTRTSWLRIDKLDAMDPRRNALTDAFAALRTSVLFEESESLPRSILVTSCQPGEGKTTVSVNLATSLARLGKRVLIIDADLRRPSVHRALGIHTGPGLIRCLTESGGWLDARRQSGIENVHVLPSGDRTQGLDASGVGDLLAGNRLGALLREAEEIYDFVIVDAPALFINAADAKLLARQVDGVIVVLRSRATPKALVERIPETLPNVIGLVVNDLLTSNLPDYFSDYFTTYDESKDRGEAPVSSSAGLPVDGAPLVGQWLHPDLQRTS